MVSDDQIMKTQTCFLQEMVQKERIQPSTVDLVHLVPFCLSLVWRPAGVEGEVGHLHQRRHLDLVVGEEVVGLGPGHLLPVAGPVPAVLAAPTRPLGLTLARSPRR